MARLAVIGAALLLVLAAPVAADAAQRSRLDSGSGLRFTLDGKRLTVAIVDGVVTMNPPLQSYLFGERIGVACGTRFRWRHGRLARDTRRWSRGAQSLAFSLDRDVSRAVRWCVLEQIGDGGDVGFVSFRRGERPRFVAKGRSPIGDWWRLSGWRSNRLEPCARLVLPDDNFSQCFADEAELEARLATVVQIPDCPADTFVYGVTARSTARVRIVLHDGASVEAAMYSRPRGSRVHAQYFIAALPGIAPVWRVEALAADGTVAARQSLPEEAFAEPCGIAIPN